MSCEKLTSSTGTEDYMKRYIKPIAAIIWKDTLLELRTKDTVVAVLVFSLLVVVVFSFAVDPTPQIVALTAPGVLWISFVFGGILGMSRSFSSEAENSSISTLLIAPIGRDAIFFGKMLSSLLFMLLVEILVFPIFAALFNFPLLVIEMVPILVLSTVAVVTVGTVFSSMSINTKAREVLLPVLFFPIALPAIIAAVEITGAVLQGSGLLGVADWLPLLAAFDLIFLVVCPVAFSFVVQD